MKKRDVIDLIHSFFKITELAVQFTGEFRHSVWEAIKTSVYKSQFMSATGIENPNKITPDNISIYSDTAQGYSVEGLGATQMKDMLKQMRIPYAEVTLPPDTYGEGQVLIVIPKGHERQANAAFSSQLSLPASHKPGLQTLNESQQALVKRISHDSGAMEALVNEQYFVEMETSASHALGLQKRFEENGILCVISEHSDGKCTMYVPRMFGPQAALLDEQIKRTRPELSRNEFGKSLRGNELLVEHKGVTEAEVSFFREKVVESGIQYCVEGTPQGNYTLKYKAQDERYLGQALYSSMMEAGGAKAKARNNYFTQKATISQQVADIGKKHACVIIDAADSSQSHDIYIDSAGMHSMDGKLIMSASSRHFDVAVQAKIQEMAAPMFDQLNKDELANIETRHAQEDLFAKDEIIKASKAAALVNKDEAGVMASKIATLITQPECNVSNQTTANNIMDTAQTLRDVADAIEETGFTMSADDMAKEFGVSVDKVDEFVTYMKNEHTTRDTRLAIKSHLEQCEFRIRNNAKTRHVCQDDYSKEDIDNTLGNPDVSDSKGVAPELNPDIDNEAPQTEP